MIDPNEVLAMDTHESSATSEKPPSADRSTFTLTAGQARMWDGLNDMPARDLLGLHRLMRRPSPFDREPLPRKLGQVAEDLAIAHRIEERDARDTGRRTSLEDVAAEYGTDLDSI